jgi:hypothetical protein
MPPSTSDLARAQRLVAEEQRLVDAQRTLIRTLAAEGRNTEAAESLLQQMLATLAIMEKTHDRIKVAMAANQNSK